MHAAVQILDRFEPHVDCDVAEFDSLMLVHQYSFCALTIARNLGNCYSNCSEPM
jgi:hypothetical protein